MKFTYLSAISISCLAACGGGGGGGGSIDNAEASFESLVARGDAVTASLDDVADITTPFSALPDTGSASYSGIAIFAEIDADSTPDVTEEIDEDAIYAALGQFEATANFGTGALTATADNFYEIANFAELGTTNTIDVDPVNAGRVSGSFDINMDITSEDDGFGTQIPFLAGAGSGSLTKLSGDTETYTDMVAARALFGPTGEVLVAAAAGESNAGAIGSLTVIAGK